MAVEITVQAGKFAAEVHDLLVSAAALQPGGAGSGIGIGSGGWVVVLVIVMRESAATVIATATVAARNDRGGEPETHTYRRVGKGRGRHGGRLGVGSGLPGIGGRLGVVLRVRGVAVGLVPRIGELLAVGLRLGVALRDSTRRVLGIELGLGVALRDSTRRVSGIVLGLPRLGLLSIIPLVRGAGLLVIVAAVLLGLGVAGLGSRAWPPDEARPVRKVRVQRRARRVAKREDPRRGSPRAAAPLLGPGGEE